MVSEFFFPTPQNLGITPEGVVRAQGLDPDLVRSRRPTLFQLTEKAIDFGLQLLTPAVVQARYPVYKQIHGRLALEGGGALAGELISSQLSGAEEVILAVCTVGNKVSEVVSNLFNADPGLAMALDGMASAAVEALANQVCREYETKASLNKLNISLPLNPGMIGWPVEEGQPQIFALLDTASIGISLSSECLIQPLKSLSFVVGLGKDLDNSRKSCEYCSLIKTCQYQEPLRSAAALET